MYTLRVLGVRIRQHTHLHACRYTNHTQCTHITHIHTCTQAFSNFNCIRDQQTMEFIGEIAGNSPWTISKSFMSVGPPIQVPTTYNIIDKIEYERDCVHWPSDWGNWIRNLEPISHVSLQNSCQLWKSIGMDTHIYRIRHACMHMHACTVECVDDDMHKVSAYILAFYHKQQKINILIWYGVFCGFRKSTWILQTCIHTCTHTLPVPFEYT